MCRRREELPRGDRFRLDEELRRFIPILQDMLKPYGFQTTVVSSPSQGLGNLTRQYADAYKRRKEIDAQIATTTKDERIKRLRGLWNKP